MRVLLLRPEGSDIPKDPEIEIVNIPILTPVCIDHSLPREFKAVGFTSVNAVKCFKFLDSIRNVKIYAVGPSTAKALIELGFSDVRIPTSYTVDSMVKEMMKEVGEGLVLVRSNIGYERDKGKYPIFQIVDYELVVNEERLEEARRLLSNCEFEFVILTSSFIAKLVKDSIRDCTKVISIGPSTTRALEGVNNIYQANEYDLNGAFILLKKLMRDD